MNLNNAKIEIAESDVFQAYEPIAREFFREILGLNFEEVLATDESQLSDFGSCLPEEDQHHLQQAETLDELYAAWGPVVLRRIESRYGFQPNNTRILLIDLFRAIEARRAENRIH